MANRIKVKTYSMSRGELERYLIKYHGEPDDIVVTGIDKPINQEVWLIKVQSSHFTPNRGDLDLLETSRNDILIDHNIRHI